MTPADETTQRLAERVLAHLRRPDARIERAGPAYRVRLGADGRTRAVLRFEEPVFRALAARAALSPRSGGWVLSRRAAGDDPPPAPSGRPGAIDGERTVSEPNGRLVQRRANLGQSPVDWLARRRDAHGRLWLTPAEVAAAERLRSDQERCAVIGRLTMDWSGLPRSGAGWTGVDPAERDRAAKQRLADALAAVGPGLREMLERVVLTGTALDAAERGLALPRRAGKTVLKLALARLAEHYGLR